MALRSFSLSPLSISREEKTKEYAAMDKQNNQCYFFSFKLLYLSFVLDFDHWNTLSSRNNIAALVLTFVQIIIFVIIIIIVVIFEVIVTFFTFKFVAPLSSLLPLPFPVHNKFCWWFLLKLWILYVSVPWFIK